MAVMKECPVCRTRLPGLRTFFRPAWSRWQCEACGSIIGIDTARRLLAIGVYSALLGLWVFVYRGAPFSPILALTGVAIAGLATIAFVDRVVTVEAAGFHCADCGYDLRGLDDERCPECGGAIADDVLARLQRIAEVPAARRRSPRARTGITIAVATVLTGFLVAGIVVNVRLSRAVRSPDTRRVLVALRQYARDHGAFPAHAAALAAEPGGDALLFVGWRTATGAGDVPMGDTTADGFDALDPAAKRAIVDAEAAGLPGEVVAHRVGDFVFTYHGLDPAAAGADHWLVILAPLDRAPAGPASAGPDPAGATGTRYVGLVDGGVYALSAGAFPAALRAENDRRAQAGLPPLPDPGAIRSDRPARPRDRPASAP